MDSLVSTQWLDDYLSDSELIVLDASKHLPDAGRDAAAEFDNAHIPGARFLDMPTLHDAGALVVNTMPQAEQVAEHLAALGVTRASRILLYDDSTIKSAARAWFILTESGFDQVAVLDGGLAKWRAEGRPTETGQANYSAAKADQLRASTRIRSKADMLSNLRSDEATVIDARDAARFGGIEAEGGHIPHSGNLWFRDLFNEDGTYKSATELRRLFAQVGIDGNKPVITTCNSGMTAAVLLFALHLIGYNDTALYDGSWAEWGADPDTPKAKGTAT